MFLDLVVLPDKKEISEELGKTIRTTCAYASAARGGGFCFQFRGKSAAVLPFPCPNIQKRTIYFLSLTREKPHIKSPTSAFTQVQIKELKEKGCLLGFCLYDLLDVQKTEIIFFASRLCLKYGVPFYVATFADELSKRRTEADVQACLRAIGFEQRSAALSTSALYTYLENSVSFL